MRPRRNARSSIPRPKLPNSSNLLSTSNQVSPPLSVVTGAVCASIHERLRLASLREHTIIVDLLSEFTSQNLNAGGRRVQSREPTESLLRGLRTGSS